MDTGIKGEEVVASIQPLTVRVNIEPENVLSIEERIRDIQSSLAAVLREVGMPDNAQRMIEKAHGPDCALCGEPCHHSFRTDTNVHAECWREEKAG